MADNIPKTFSPVAFDSIPKEDSEVFVKIPQKKFAVIMRQILASNHLYNYLMEVENENKRLQKQNKKLEAAILRTGKQISEVILHRNRDNIHDSFSSLPSRFHENLPNGRETAVQVIIKQLVDSINENRNTCNQGNILRLIGQERSSKSQIFFPSSMAIPERPDIVDSKSVSLPEENVEKNDSHSSTFSNSSGVSQQYFDAVVNELAKSKRLIQELLNKNEEDPKVVLNTLKMKQMIKYLEERNKQLSKSNHQLRTLLESQSVDSDTSQHSNVVVLHNKLEKLQREIEQKDITITELNKKCEVLKSKSQQTSDVHKQKEVQDSFSQTEIVSSCENSVSVQTDNGIFDICDPGDVFKAKDAPKPAGVSKTDDTSESADVFKTNYPSEPLEVSRTEEFSEPSSLSSMSKMSESAGYLRSMVDNLRTANSILESRNAALEKKNTDLEKHCKQLLQNMISLENHEEALNWKEEKSSLVCSLKRTEQLLKEKTKDCKHFLKQVQGLQNEVGQLNLQKNSLEAKVKKDKQGYEKKEVQFLHQCRILQDQFDRAVEENKKLERALFNERQASGPGFVGVGCRPKKNVRQEVISETSLVVDSDPSSNFQVEQLIVEHDEKADNSREEEMKCRHCLRTDFSTLDSFHSHLKKCGD